MEPKKLQRMCSTRWMTWLPTSTVILKQWMELKEYFKVASTSNDFKAATLYHLYNEPCNRLYLTFLRSVLEAVNLVNLAFQQGDADVTKLYADLRRLVFSMCARVLTEKAIAQTQRPGVLRSDELQMLKDAFKFKINVKPVDRVDLVNLSKYCYLQLQSKQRICLPYR